MMAEVGLVEAILTFLSTMTPAWGIVFLISIAVCIKIMRGGSIKEIIGFKNGIVREEEYRTDMQDLKDRFDRQHEEIKGMREKMQEFDVSFAKLETKVEQYRRD